MLAQRKSSEKAHHLADGDADRYPTTPPFQNSATVIVHSLFFAYNT